MRLNIILAMDNVQFYVVVLEVLKHGLSDCDYVLNATMCTVYTVYYVNGLCMCAVGVCIFVRVFT